MALRYFEAFSAFALLTFLEYFRRFTVQDFLVLSREWGNGLWGTMSGKYIGTIIGIHSPIPY